MNAPCLPRRLPTAALACLLALLGPLSGAAARAEPLGDTRQLLDWLGVAAVIDQTHAIAERALLSEARRRDATPAQQSQWRAALMPRLNPITLRERVVRGVAAEIDAATLALALTRLQVPLAKRARFFEQALAQPGAAQGLAEFRAQFEAVPNPARRQLAKQWVEVSHAAALVATWQTAIAQAVTALAGAPLPAAGDAVRERTLYLTPLAQMHALYTYRYFSDAELRTYRDILAEPSVQAVLAASAHQLLAALD